MFRWGVAQELVSPITADALKYVPALRLGKTTAPESKPREDVPNDVVDATLPYLLPTVAAMVQVQQWATMRPSEVCRMRVGDIDMSRKDGIWLYHLPLHKTEATIKQKKIVPLGKPEQALIRPYLEGKSPERAVFSPKTTMLERYARDAKNRTTKIPPNKLRRSHKAVPKRTASEHYCSKSYARSIRRAIEQANRSLSDAQQIPHWFPYQLRHAGVTELVAENDGNLGVARAVAGHKSLAITLGYNHADLKIAIEQAKKRRQRRNNA